MTVRPSTGHHPPEPPASLACRPGPAGRRPAATKGPNPPCPPGWILPLARSDSRLETGSIRPLAWANSTPEDEGVRRKQSSRQTRTPRRASTSTPRPGQPFPNATSCPYGSSPDPPSTGNHRQTLRSIGQETQLGFALTVPIEQEIDQPATASRGRTSLSRTRIPGIAAGSPRHPRAGGSAPRHTRVAGAWSSIGAAPRTRCRWTRRVCTGARW